MPDWLDKVQRELVACRLPADYQDRLLAELRDHVEDLHFAERMREMSAEVMSSSEVRETAWESRLGDPQQIAQLARDNVMRRRFAGRHPILTFVVLPVPLLVVLWIAYAAGLVGLFSGLDRFREAAWAISLAGFLAHALAYVPALAATLVLAWWADRSRTAISWRLAAGGLIGLVSGMLIVTFRAPTTPGTGLLSIGLGFPPALGHWPQIAVPVAVMAAGVVWTMSRRRGTAVATPA